MSKEKTNIKQRILQFAEIQEGKKSVFFKKCGIAYSNFTGSGLNSTPKSDILERILDIYPKANIDWLITGRGSMLKSVSAPQNGGSGNGNTNIQINGEIKGDMTTYKPEAVADIERLKKSLEHAKNTIKQLERIIETKDELIEALK